MNYREQYTKYLQRYKAIKSMYIPSIGGSYEYLKKSGLKELPEPAKYVTTVLEKYFDNFDNLDVLEVGIGNARRTIKLAKMFNSYTGLEPHDELYEISTKNCKKHDCNMEIINKTIETYETDKKYDIIIFINAFHYIDLSKIDRVFNLLKDNGILYIKEPTPVPKGWGAPRLNIDSPEFIERAWNRKKNMLLDASQFLTENGADYYDIESSNISVLKKPINFS